MSDAFKVTVRAHSIGETRAHGVSGEIHPVARFEGDVVPAFDECVEYEGGVYYYRTDVTGERCLCKHVVALSPSGQEVRRRTAPESTQGVLAPVFSDLVAAPDGIVAWIDTTRRQ